MAELVKDALGAIKKREPGAQAPEMGKLLRVPDSEGPVFAGLHPDEEVNVHLEGWNLFSSWPERLESQDSLRHEVNKSLLELEDLQDDSWIVETRFLSKLTQGPVPRFSGQV